ncbi:MAG: thiazole synthase, partial [Myxococcales bacterium]|nr:thiazole synthase [Myxococcales bacterium]
MGSADSDLVIGKHTFTSRLLVGTGKYPNADVARTALAESGAQVVTVAVRRVNLDHDAEDSIWAQIDLERFTLLPNTAGCTTKDEAIRTAMLAREVGMGDLVKIEVIADAKTLFPDNQATIEAAQFLIGEGFTVLPYITDDLVVCKKLRDVGAAAVMPLGAPIGSGLGIRNRVNVRLIVEAMDIPVIVDAGVGTASD